ncbi:hypothetical protein L3Q65_00895 (plasmid) [Amycolatopsis sp. FU40]|uniref:hypothetical protein n=1 Tax=Amycolatopsis sp. FU40 TaxID=2914159 RepID=UPI001F18D60C|nr:hypothetical protein [Amycolatopsis sp. FU40]UKD50882.1 hypothetical protein L3Q65_00895 [Amycolatopsis sp. FU40]
MPIATCPSDRPGPRRERGGPTFSPRTAPARPQHNTQEESIALTPKQEELRTLLVQAARQGDETGDWTALKTLNANLSQPDRTAIKDAIQADLLGQLWPHVLDMLA